MSAARQLLTDYAASQVSFHDFMLQFSRETWDRAASDDDRELIRAAELLLAEHTNGHRSEEDLRRSLTGLLGVELHFDVRSISYDQTHIYVVVYGGYDQATVWDVPRHQTRASNRVDTPPTQLVAVHA